MSRLLRVVNRERAYCSADPNVIQRKNEPQKILGGQLITGPKGAPNLGPEDDWQRCATGTESRPRCEGDDTEPQNPPPQRSDLFSALVRRTKLP